jgi:hypothetical protein
VEEVVSNKVVSVHPLHRWAGLTFVGLLDKKRSMTGQNVPGPYHSFRRIFRKCAELQRLITHSDMAQLEYAQDLDFHHQDMENKKTTIPPEEPRQLSFINYSKRLADPVIAELIGSLENASYNRQLAEHFKLEPLPVEPSSQQS